VDKMKKLIAFDDHRLIAETYRLVFENHFEVRFAYNKADFFTLLYDTPPDVVVLGVNPSFEKYIVDMTRRIRRDFPATKIFAFANEDTAETIEAMMKEGMNGFIGKREASVESFLEAVQKVMRGEEYIGVVESSKPFLVH
jgi:DNA-binding NarL/FixJ family response regulator